MADGTGGIPVGILAQFGFGVLGDQAGAESVVFIGFPSDDRFDVDAGEGRRFGWLDLTEKESSVGSLRAAL